MILIQKEPEPMEKGFENKLVLEVMSFEDMVFDHVIFESIIFEHIIFEQMIFRRKQFMSEASTCSAGDDSGKLSRAAPGREG